MPFEPPREGCDPQELSHVAMVGRWGSPQFRYIVEAKHISQPLRRIFAGLTDIETGAVRPHHRSNASSFEALPLDDVAKLTNQSAGGPASHEKQPAISDGEEEELTVSEIHLPNDDAHHDQGNYKGHRTKLTTFGRAR